MKKSEDQKWCICDKPDVLTVPTRGIVCGKCNKLIKQERERIVIV